MDAGLTIRAGPSLDIVRGGWCLAPWTPLSAHPVSGGAPL